MKLAKISVLLFFIAVCTNTSVAQGKIRVKETHGDLFEQEGRGFIDVVKLPNGGYMEITTRMTSPEAALVVQVALSRSET